MSSAQDALKWLSNIVSSVSIVLVNKQLMGPEGFMYATTLCGMHFLSTVMIRCFLCQTPLKEGVVTRDELPRAKLLAFVGVASTSIVSANVSLMLNHIGFYQLCKLLQIPTVALMEFIFNGRRISLTLMLALALVMLGVGVATVQETSTNFWGTVFAVIAVLSTSAQQLLVGRLQSEYKIGSNDLLGRTAPRMAASMLFIGPFLDMVLTGRWVTDYKWKLESLSLFVLSCLLAIWVNISQYMCIGTFSALSFQVIGHTKTVFIFIFGWLIFDIPVSWNNIVGGMIAVGGISYYSRVVAVEKLEIRRCLQDASRSNRQVNTMARAA